MSDQDRTAHTSLLTAQIGRRLRNLRENASLDVPAFAKLCGIPTTSIEECESGSRRLSAPEMAKAASACGVTIAYFLAE